MAESTNEHVTNNSECDETDNNNEPKLNHRQSVDYMDEDDDDDDDNIDENFEIVLREGVKTGKCKWFNSTKGWGFVTLDEGGQDVFVHQSILQMKGFRQLGEKEEVEIEFQLTEKGLEAVKVTGPNGEDCRGSNTSHPPKRIFRKIRCYNCGEFKNHLASKCQQPPQPKKCHNCKSDEHLIADCPTKPVKEPRPSTSTSTTEPIPSTSTSAFEPTPSTSTSATETTAIASTSQRTTTTTNDPQEGTSTSSTDIKPDD